MPKYCNIRILAQCKKWLADWQTTNCGPLASSAAPVTNNQEQTTGMMTMRLMIIIFMMMLLISLLSMMLMLMMLMRTCLPLSDKQPEQTMFWRWCWCWCWCWQWYRWWCWCWRKLLRKGVTKCDTVTRCCYKLACFTICIITIIIASLHITFNIILHYN